MDTTVVQQKETRGPCWDRASHSQIVRLNSRAAFAHEERNDKQYDEDEEEDLRDLHRGSRKNAESEDRGNQRDDEEGNSPA